MARGGGSTAGSGSCRRRPQRTTRRRTCHFRQKFIFAPKSGMFRPSYAPELAVQPEQKRGGAIMHRAISVVVRPALLWIAAGVLILGQPGLALSQAPEQTIFGPKQYEHPAAGTSQAADTVAVPADVTAPFTLRIQDGAGEERVNAGWVYLNGVQIVGPADFQPQVGELARPVPLQAGNELVVVIRGRAGTRLNLSISGRLIPPTPTGLAPGPVTISAGATVDVVATLA